MPHLSKAPFGTLARSTAFASLCAAALFTSPTPAATPYLVKDLDARTSGGERVILGENAQAVFFASTGGLYRTDGTFGGTYGLTLDIGDAKRTDAIRVNGRLVLCTNRGLTGSDGTIPGTWRLPSMNCFGPMVAFRNEAYFHRNLPSLTIWKTNGTPEGTVPVPMSGRLLGALPNTLLLDDGGELLAWNGTTAPISLGYHPVQSVATAGSRAFFLWDELSGAQIWTTDGTVAGTRSEATLPPGSSYYTALTALGNQVLFRWGNNMPWVSDGTQNGTKPLASTPLSGSGPDFEVSGSIAYYVSNGKLWKTDGTFRGTAAVHPEMDFSEFAVSPSRVLIREPNGSLWSSNGSQRVHLGDFPAPVALHQNGATDFGGRTFFANAEPEHGPEIWATNGTAAGTAVVRILWPGTKSANLIAIVAGPERALLSTETRGTFATDGTPAGTRPLTHEGKQIGAARSLFWINETGYACGNRLWRTTGTGDETTALSQIGESCQWAAALGNSVFFTLWNPDTHVLSLWTSDGTLAGTSRVKHLGSSPLTTGGTPLGNRMLFAYDESTLGNEPWVSDGTAQGTHRLKDVLAGEGHGIVGLPVVHGSHAYFLPYFTYELWRTDGTEAGTERVLPNLQVYSIAGTLDGKLLVAGWTPSVDGLWSTDGTPQGTQIFKDFSGDPSDTVWSSAVSGGLLFFSTRGAFGTRPNVWVSDGTPAGTTLLATNVYGANLAAVPGGIAFAGTPGSAVTSPPLFLEDPALAASEPWFSDGTPAGTRLLGDIIPGINGSVPKRFQSLGSRVLFSADNYFFGRELWAFDLVATGGGFYTVEPCRIADTRMPEHQPPLHSPFLRFFQVTGVCGVPADAKAVALNVTVTGSDAPGFVELSSFGRGNSVVAGSRSTSVVPGQTRASSTMLGLDPNSEGRVTVWLFGAGTADVILDVSGYFR